MKILIEIPDQKYKWIVDNPQIYTDDLCEAIRNGTLLPKGHGRLIDEKELIEEIECEEIDGSYYDVIYAHSVYDAPTIIEADKEGEI